MLTIKKPIKPISIAFMLCAVMFMGLVSAGPSVEGSVNSNVTVNDIYPPVITIILPQTTGYSISSLNFNVSLNENGSVWFTFDSGLINYSMDSTNNQNFNYTIALPDGSHTVLFYANDTSDRLSNKSVTFSIDTSIGGGSPGTGGGLIIPSTETDPYNVTFLCEQADHFIKLHLINGSLNYTETEFNYFKNNVVIGLGVGISNRVLRAFVENFEGNCPDFKEVPGEDVIPDEPVEEKPKPNLTGLWILIGLIILALVVGQITIRKYVLALLLLNKRKKKED